MTIGTVRRPLLVWVLIAYQSLYAIKAVVALAQILWNRTFMFNLLLLAASPVYCFVSVVTAVGLWKGKSYGWWLLLIVQLLIAIFFVWSFSVPLARAEYFSYMDVLAAAVASAIIITALVPSVRKHYVSVKG